MISAYYFALLAQIHLSLCHAAQPSSASATSLPTYSTTLREQASHFNTLLNLASFIVRGQLYVLIVVSNTTVAETHHMP
ncbi:hypothetical protein BV25DRAFT_1828420, partial [Artomyces pyxidatus]